MDDSQIKQLFSGFRPTLSDDVSFMARLDERLAIIDDVLEYRERLRRQSRRAIVVAALLGFLTGVVFSLLLPYLQSFITILIDSFSLTVSSLNLPGEIPLPSMVISWCILAVAVIAASLSSYNLMLSRIRPPEI